MSDYTFKTNYNGYAMGLLGVVDCQRNPKIVAMQLLGVECGVGQKDLFVGAHKGNSLTHLFTHPLTHPLNHSPTHPSLTRWYRCRYAVWFQIRVFRLAMPAGFRGSNHVSSLDRSIVSLSLTLPTFLPFHVRRSGTRSAVTTFYKEQEAELQTARKVLILIPCTHKQ
jgi:hypothetical protein